MTVYLIFCRTDLHFHFAISIIVLVAGKSDWDPNNISKIDRALVHNKCPLSRSNALHLCQSEVFTQILALQIGHLLI